MAMGTVQKRAKATLTEAGGGVLEPCSLGTGSDLAT